MTAAPKRIVLATIGSLGDLHPMLALGLELQRRGHHIVLATTPFYRGKIERLGLEFHPLRPDWDPTDQQIIAQCEDLKSGPEVLLRKLVLPHLRHACQDLQIAVAGADLMIAGELVYAAPLIAEKLKLPWISAILSPTSFFSAYDPSLLVNLPWAYRLRGAGWRVNRAILEAGRLATRHWWEPVRQLRRELGLRTECNPVLRDKFSPWLVLALFSSSLARPQPDWPENTLQPGFVFFEEDRAGWGSAELEAFLAAGEAPVVFTLGSTAVHHPGSFYEVSSAAARAVNRRAVLLGIKSTVRPAGGHEDGHMLQLPYAPYSQIFPRAAAIVHQGGSGTTGQALRAGRPQLIVPFGWDQPDNGARVARLGAGLCLERNGYTIQAAAGMLERVLGDRQMAGRALQVARAIGSEEALSAACDAVEAVLSRES